MTVPVRGRVRIGLIGAGDIAGAHVAGYRLNPELVEFAAVADPVRESAEKRRGADEDVRIHADYREMIAHGDLDTTNIVVDGNGDPWLVDFDQASPAAGDRLLERDEDELRAALGPAAPPERSTAPAH